MTLDIIRFDDLPISAWHNGAGRKADIAATAEWSVGFAWLETDAPFSDLAGRDRTITLVRGPGFTLDFADRPALHVTDPFRPSAFDGGWPTQCRLLGGAGLVLNAMTARARYRHTVQIVSAEPVAEITPGPAEAFFLVLLTGTATVADAAVAIRPNDAVHADRPFTLRATPGALACAITIGLAPAPSGGSGDGSSPTTAR